ncbi:hypothetical protein BJ944DRAFT_243487 [Cunninghamella echinulata]|nr:hypothetical protein BJ944DRAFT_243487 [Cunninghamella echinulata]
MVVSDELVAEWITSLETFNKNRVQQLYTSSPFLLWQPLPFNNNLYPHFMTHLSNQELLKNITIDQCYSIQLVLISIYEKEATININAKETIAFLIKMCEVGDLNTFYWGSTKNSTLHLACNLGQLSIIRQLIKHGVSTDALNDDGLSPIDFAISNKVVDILKENGSSSNSNSDDNNSNSSNDNVNISKKSKEDNANNSNRFERLRQFAEESSNNTSSSSLLLPSSIQRQNSTRKYVQPGHIETRKRQVLQQNDDTENNSNNNSNSNAGSNKTLIKKDSVDMQKTSKLNTTNKRLQEVESLAKQSRVKNNPLFKKFEQQSNTTTTTTPNTVGKRSLKIPNIESIQDRRISKGITSLKDRSFVSASVFRQKDESSASKENLLSPTAVATAKTTTADNKNENQSFTVANVEESQPIDNNASSITVIKIDEPQTSDDDDEDICNNNTSRTITSEEKYQTDERNIIQETNEVNDNDPQPTIFEERTPTAEANVLESDLTMNDDEDDSGFNIIDDYAESDIENENTAHSENNDKICDVTNDIDNGDTTTKQNYSEDNYDSKSNMDSHDYINRNDKSINDTSDDDDANDNDEVASIYNPDSEDDNKLSNEISEKEIHSTSDQEDISTATATTQSESEVTTNPNNKRISTLRMSHLSIASNSTDGEQWFDSYEENADNEARKSAMLANINNYYQKKTNDENTTPRQSFVTSNYDSTSDQQTHPDSASASTYRYSRGSEESHATFKFQSYDHSDTESSTTWPPPSPTKIEAIQRIHQTTLQNNPENSTHQINDNGITIVNNSDHTDDDNSIYEEQLQIEHKQLQHDPDPNDNEVNTSLLNNQAVQLENKIEPQQQSSLSSSSRSINTNKNGYRYSQKEDREEPTGHVIVATKPNFVVHRLSHFQRMHDNPTPSSSVNDRSISTKPVMEEVVEEVNGKENQDNNNMDDYVQTKTEVRRSEFELYQQQYHYNPEQEEQYEHDYNPPEQNYPILPLIPEAASTGYGKLYVRLSCAQDILLPIPLETTYVRCVISDGYHEYISRYEVLNNKVNFQYECTVDTHPDMIITVALQVRPDPHVQPLTGISRFFTTIQRQKKTLLGYVHPEEFIIGQSRFALNHMVHACDQKTYHANFDCFNSWFTRSTKEKKRLAHTEGGQVLKVVGNLAVDLLYLPVSDPSMKIPNTLQECDLALKIRQWHGTCWRTGYLSTRPKGQTIWERYYFQLIGSQLLGYQHEKDINEHSQHYNMTEAIQLTVAAEQILVDVNKMKSNNIPYDDTTPFNYSKNPICQDNRRGYFRITFRDNDYIDCVCDHVKESELWVNTFRAMIGKVPLTVSSSVFLN